MSTKLNGFKLFADGQEIGTATSISLPKIDCKSVDHAIVLFPKTFQNLEMKLKKNGEFVFFGWDEWYKQHKELEQRKNRQLLPGTCIGEIK